MHQARYFDKLDGQKVQCQLCPHNCIIHNDKVGICRQRKNVSGILYSLNYGKIVSLSLDPMEKKPLYHFHPGKRIMSAGTNGCNLGCQFCQNWTISQENSPTEDITPGRLMALATQYNTKFIAYTYNEPFVWYEYVLESAKAAKKHGFKNVLVTNGYVNLDPFKELLPYISAMNIDIKSVNDDFYQRLCKARLESVFEIAKIARGKTHIEITNLVITGENDKVHEFEEMARWVADNLGRDTPLHFSAYFPSHKLDNPATRVETLITAYRIAKRHLDFVYLGNVATAKEGMDTDCCKCGAKLIVREGYQIKIGNLTPNGKCNHCGSENNIKL